jgi:chemotaxis protein histidine kinase CheA
MEQAAQDYRKLVEIEVESFQGQLEALERDPEQLHPLKSILRAAQRLRHARDDNEPMPVRLLRNAVEKVTLHLGHANLSVSREFLDFYLDSFDLLEESVRRWPDGASFDRARYADRTRFLLELTEPARAVQVSGTVPEPAAGPGAEPARMEADAASRQAAASDAKTDGDQHVEEPSGLAPILQEVPTWAETSAGPGLELLAESEIAEGERDLFVEMDLRELLVEPWAEPWTRHAPAPVESVPAPRTPYAEAPAGTGALAASFSTLESLRSGGAAAETADIEPSVRFGIEPRPAAREALERVRDSLDALSITLRDLDRAAERLLEEGPGSLGGSTVTALVERLELEKQKLVSTFERQIQSLRGSVG